MFFLVSVVSRLRTCTMVHEKHKSWQNRHDPGEDRIRHRGQFTILPKPMVLFFFAPRTTHRTRRHSSAAEEKEVVITNDEPHDKATIAKAEHHGPRTRAWCGPPLLVLLGGVVMLFVFSACCRMSRFLGFGSAKKNKTSETQHEPYSYSIQKVLTFPSQSVRGSVSHTYSGRKER